MKLSKIGKIILAVSLIVGLSFVALGIFKCVENEKTKNDSTKKTAIHEYDNDADKNIFVTDKDDYCNVKFKPLSAGNHTVCIKGATLECITDAKGHTIKGTADNTAAEGYECSYTIFLTLGTEYTFKLRSDSGSVEINIVEPVKE